MKIEGVSPEEYASWWGCDPVFDKAPRHPGDGYLFYNFGSKCQERTAEWLNTFAAAIGRTLKGKLSSKDRRGLKLLMDHVTGLIQISKLDDFTRGYLDAALWSSTDSDNRDATLDRDYHITDIEQDSLSEMVAECEKFQADNSALLVQAYEQYPDTHCSPQAYAGHDLWMTRVGSGCGYWDGDLSKDVGDALTAAAKAIPGTPELYVGDDKLIHYGK